MKLDRCKAYTRRTGWLRNLTWKNPVVTSALSLPFLVVSTYSLNSAAFIAASMVLVSLPVLLLRRLIGRRIPGPFSPVFYGAVAFAALMAVRWAGEWLMPTVFSSMGIYFYLIPMNSFLYLTIDHWEEAGSPGRPLRFALWHLAGFVLICLLMGLVRGVLVGGAFFQEELFGGLSFSGAYYPFFGFVLLGMIAGAMRWLHRVVLVVLLRRDQPKEERRPLLWRRRMKRGEW